MADRHDGFCLGLQFGRRVQHGTWIGENMHMVDWHSSILMTYKKLRVEDVAVPNYLVIVASVTYLYLPRCV